MKKFLLGLLVGLFLGAIGGFAIAFCIGWFVLVPQIRRANQDWQKESTVSTLQTLRGQIELFKVQHGDRPPAAGALVEVMMGKTNASDVAKTDPAGTYGPYFPSAFPVNPENGQSAVGLAPSPSVGWVYTVHGSEYRIEAVNAEGTGVMAY